MRFPALATFSLLAVLLGAAPSLVLAQDDERPRRPPSLAPT